MQSRTRRVSVEQIWNGRVHERYELIGGVIYDMSPSPSTMHQVISGNLFREFSVYLKGRSCKISEDSFDVYLKNGIDEWVILYLSIICYPTKSQDKWCVGAPDIIVEILSKSTAAKDRAVKLKLYRTTGVKEYWTFDPYEETVEVYKFSGNLFSAPDTYGVDDDGLKVDILGDLEIKLSEIFGD